MDSCRGCVHIGYDRGNPNYMGNCGDCIRNPNYSDFYYQYEGEDT